MTNKGAKYGRDPVRAISDPLDGRIITGRVTAANVNFDSSLVGPGSSPAARQNASVPIEGVVVKCNDDNTGSISVVEAGGDFADGYPLAAGQSISIHVDNLNKVSLRIPTANDVVNYIAIAQKEADKL